MLDQQVVRPEHGEPVTDEQGVQADLGEMDSMPGDVEGYQRSTPRRARRNTYGSVAAVNASVAVRATSDGMLGTQ